MKQYHLINVVQLTLTGLFFASAFHFLDARTEGLPHVAPTIRVFDWDVATISLIVTAIGTFFAIFFRWRADVRNSLKAEATARRTEARFRRLEYEIEQIKARLDRSA